MKNLLASKGLLATHAPLISDITLVLILLTAILFTIGWQLARHKHFDAHRWVQTSSATLNALVVLSVMVNIFILHILRGFQASFLPATMPLRPSMPSSGRAYFCWAYSWFCAPINWSPKVSVSKTTSATCAYRMRFTCWLPCLG